MFYYLSSHLKDTVFFANVFHYTSFRAVGALLTTLFFALLFGSWFIDIWADFFRSNVREHTPEAHKAKNNLPTMGGIFILITVLLSTLLWGDLGSRLVWVFLLGLFGFGAIGFWDDWSKIRRFKGISARSKFIAQWSVAALVAFLWVYWAGAKTTICFPFFKNFNPDLGFLFVFWAMFIIVSCSNAVNLTDGLDGLAIGSLLPNFALYSVIAFLAGHFLIAAYLNIPFANSAEMTVMGSALIGASLGFLWYNAYPAQVFMGDVGSLALGAGLALMALMAKQELLRVISGGLFVIETVSVLLQVFVYKRWKRRIFKMAPIHHHFELLGWPEAKITTRFGIISLVLCLLAFITLKLR
ncbi:phospho-N-acetylmuramoyl-pentapeptide-transferase [soil metagenome]